MSLPRKKQRRRWQAFGLLALSLTLWAESGCARRARAPRPAMTAEDYIEQGIASYREGDRNKAIADFDQAIRLDPNSADAYNDRGIVRQDRNDLDGAIADFDAALKINPRLPGTLLNRGIARQDKHDLTGAIADFDAALKIDPRLAKAYLNRGIALHEKGDVDRALRRPQQGGGTGAHASRGLQQPRHRPRIEKRSRGGHRRLWRGHSIKPRLRRRLPEPRIAASKNRQERRSREGFQ